MMTDKAKGLAGPLVGYRIIDFGQYLSGPLTAMLLADQGAEVIRVDPPDGPRYKSAANAVLNRGKKSIALDLKAPSDRETARALVRSANVVIENFRPGVMDRLGLGEKWAFRVNPKLIYLSMPGFPKSDTRRRHWRAWEGIVAAATSHYRDTDARKLLIENTPLYTALPMASYYAGIEGALAVCLGLLRQRISGVGAALEVSLFNASMSAFGYMSLHIHDLPRRYKAIGGMSAGTGLTAFPEMRARGELATMRAIYDSWRSPFYFNYPCADGRLLFLCADLNRLHLERAIRVLGLEAIIKHLGLRRDSPYRDLGSTAKKNLYSVDQWSREDKLIVRNYLHSIFTRRHALDWERELGEAGIPCTIQRALKEYVKESWVRTSNLMREVTTPDQGRMLQPNRLVFFSDEVASSRDISPPSRLDEDRAQITSALYTAQGVNSDSAYKSEATSRNPLAGITVLDLTNVISGPTCGRALAECGADVIKIDPPDLTHSPGITIHMGIDVNRGKRSVLLDLKTADGREVFDKLVCKSDVVIYNGPDQVMQRLRLTYNDLSKANPRVIVCQISAFGSAGRGSWTNRQGYDDVVQAANGCQVRFGGPHDPRLHGTASCLDYSTGYAAAFAITLALIRRAEEGVGCQVCTSLALAGQFVQLPFCFDYKGRGSWDEPQGQDAWGSGPLNRIYKTADGWIFISLPSSEVGRLVDITELRLRGDENSKELELSLQAALVFRTTIEWEEIFNRGEVGAHRVCSLSELRAARIRDVDKPERFVDNDDEEAPVFLRYPHQIGSKAEHLAPAWLRGDLGGLKMGTAAPQYGEHSEAVLRELGYSADQLTRLINSGAVATQVIDNK